jgi:hypothetical protein
LRLVPIGQRHQHRVAGRAFHQGGDRAGRTERRRPAAG